MNRRFCCSSLVLAWILIVPARADVAPSAARVSAPTIEQFRVVLPQEKNPMPAPQGAFAWRGMKGWMWSPRQYLEEIPVVAEYRMNFLMSCYGSLFQGLDENPPRWRNPWWEPLPEDKRRGFEAVVRSCQKHGITFCFSTNPNLASTRPLKYDSDEDFTALWQHYAWMQGLGVRWFCVSLDDISQGIDAEGQARLLNRLLARLREKDAGAQLITTLPYYWGTGDKPNERAFLSIIAKQLHPDVYIFWTGNEVINTTITRQEAEAYKAAVKHRLFLWDNYPVNDAHPTMNLGPLVGRDPELPAAIDGYMANSMCPQNQINRIPIWTAAEYANDPAHYDPAASIGQAIVHNAKNPAQRRALAELVEFYPGWEFFNRPHLGWSVPRTRFAEIMKLPDGRYLADVYLSHAEALQVEMARQFPRRFTDAQKTLSADVARMRAAYEKQYTTPTR